MNEEPDFEAIAEEFLDELSRAPMMSAWRMVPMLRKVFTLGLEHAAEACDIAAQNPDNRSDTPREHMARELADIIRGLKT